MPSVTYDDGYANWQISSNTRGTGLAQEERGRGLGAITMVVLVLGVFIVMGITETLAASFKPSVIGRLQLRRIGARALNVRAAGSWVRVLLRFSFVEMRTVTLMVAAFVTVPGMISILYERAVKPEFVVEILFGGLAIVGLLFVGLSLVWLVAGIVFSPIAAIVDLETREPSRPYDLLRFDRAAGAGAMMLLGALPVALSPGWPSVHDVAMAALIALALIVLISGVAVRYGLAVTMLAVTGRGPLSLRQFLDWCVQVGLLREAGTAYQFRHIELQRWLAEDSEPTLATQEQPSAEASP